MDKDPILAVKGLSRAFGGFHALSDVSFEVPQGGVHAFIGPNGAGKTTLFNCIAGVLRPSAGNILLHGEDITSFPQHRRTQAGLSRSFQVTNLFAALSVFENVRLGAQAQAGRRSFSMFGHKDDLGDVNARAEGALRNLNLLSHASTSAGELSHGQQRRLEIAVALVSDAPLLLLDEPTSGMGIDDLKEMTDIIAAIGARRTVLLVEHNIKLVMTISHSILVLHHGRVLTRGRPQDVAGDARVKAAYLGSQA